MLTCTCRFSYEAGVWTRTELIGRMNRQLADCRAEELRELDHPRPLSGKLRNDPKPDVHLATSKIEL
jgi:hypothetical protein